LTMGAWEAKEIDTLQSWELAGEARGDPGQQAGEEQ
jgi:hypothetical protein